MSIPIANVRGIEIRVHLTFALVLLWAAFDWGISQGLGFAGAVYGLLFVSLLFVCVTLHELGHSLFAIRYGARVRDITLYPIGGVAHLEGDLSHPKHEFWMALAGPAVNIVLVVILGTIAIPLMGWRALDGMGVLWSRLQGLGPERLLMDLLATNLGLALFNLLPAFPLDGGRVLRAALATRMGELKATQIAVQIGQGLAMLVGLAGFFTGALNLILIAAFIFLSAAQEWRGTQLKAALRRLPASAALIKGGVILSPYDTLARAINAALLTGQSDFAVFNQGYLVGVLTRQDIAAGFQRYGPNIEVGRLTHTHLPTAHPGDSLWDIHHKLEKSGSPAVSVVENGRFLGLATVESVRRALQFAVA